MPSTGGSSIEITASDRRARRTISSFFRDVENGNMRLSRRLARQTPFDALERSTARLNRTIGRELHNLPDHLKPFHRELNQTRRGLRDLQRQGSRSLDELADSAIQTRTSLERMTSVTDSGKDAIRIVDNLSESVRETQLAVMGLNRDGTLRISSEESTEQLRRFREETARAQRELEAIRDAGDFASYEAGMRVLQHRMGEVDRSFRAVARGGQAYTNMLRQLGIVTSATANQSAIAMEAYKDQFLRSVDLMNARATQASKMMKILPETSNLQTVDRFFLGIGDRLENMAKQGTAANLAIQMLGRNASMKDLQDRITLINAGIMRMQQVSLVAGIALAGFTAIMFNAAKGPDVSENLEKQKQAMQEYKDAVEQRTQEIVNAWSLFSKVTLEKTNPRTLYLNLEQQIKVLEKWRSNLKILASRAGTEFAEYVGNMGPSAAAEVDALTRMSEPGLKRYVAMWRKEYKLAREQAVSELEGLRMKTEQTIKNLQEQLTPLGIAIEKFQDTWAQASGPFVETWGDFAAKVVDAATAVGNLVNQVNQLNPSITAAAGMFTYLFTAMTLILSPMAIGIGRANGMKAAFSFVVTTFKPLILGFLRIAGAASVVSAIIVIVVGTFMKLWQNSERLRTAVGNLWTILKSVATTAAEPLINAFKQISSEFVGLINQMVGSKGQSMTSFWQRAGDLIAMAIEKITVAIKFLSPVFRVVFTFIANIVLSSFNNIVNIVKSGIAIITNIIGLFKNLAVGNFKGAWGNIKAIFVNTLIFIWNYIQLMFVGKMLGAFRGFAKSGLTILKSGWNGIKAAALAVFAWVRDFILGIFRGINTGVTGTTTKLVGGISRLWQIFWNTTRSIFSAIYNFFKTIFQSIYQFIIGRAELTWRTVHATWNLFWRTTVQIFRSLYNALIAVFKSLWQGLTNSAKSIRTGLENAWTTLKKNTSSIFKSIWKNVTNTFDNIVKGSKNLPGRIGKGISSMAGGVASGVKDLGNKISSGLENVLNGAVNGINSVLKKLKVNEDLWLPTVKLPRYKDGVDGHPGGFMMVGDGRKHEFVQYPDGQLFLSPNKPTVMYGPKGTNVLDGNRTESILKGMPKYKSGVGKKLKKLYEESKKKTTEIAHDTKNKVVAGAGIVKDKAAAGAGKVKDLALDVWDYMGDVPGMMKKVWNHFVPDFNIGGPVGGIAKKGISRLKDGALQFVEDQMASLFALDYSGGFEKDPRAVGPGSGKGGMMRYVEHWYNQVKDRFGPTRFMGGYNNRNVVGGKSKSMHAYGRAFDLGGSPSVMKKIAEYLRTTAGNLQYVIYNHRIAGPGVGKPWRKYTGKNKHTDHVHADFKAQGGGGGGRMPVGSGVERWRGIAAQALRMTGQFSPANLNRLLMQMKTESGGDPRAINTWDKHLVPFRSNSVEKTG